ncbi:MAG: FKBP-type peptidyl-prolyl cis-trans isomerase SlpA [Oleiphilaceae bacterium]
MVLNVTKNSLIKVGENTKVCLHFSLSLSDGSVVDSTFDKAPASFEFGDGQLPDGFQAYLAGLVAGDKDEFMVPPEKSFGMPNPNNSQMMKRSDFPADMELVEGLMISFADANKSELPGIVKHFDENEVEIDFNHPLAGETLKFVVEIQSVEAL